MRVSVPVVIVGLNHSRGLLPEEPHAQLVAEPQNVHDHNALRVWVAEVPTPQDGESWVLGYVQRHEAAVLAPLWTEFAAALIVPPGITLRLSTYTAIDVRAVVTFDSMNPDAALAIIQRLKLSGMTVVGSAESSSNGTSAAFPAETELPPGLGSSPPLDVELAELPLLVREQVVRLETKVEPLGESLGREALVALHGHLLRVSEHPNGSAVAAYLSTIHRLHWGGADKTAKLINLLSRDEEAFAQLPERLQRKVVACQSALGFVADATLCMTVMRYVAHFQAQAAARFCHAWAAGTQGQEWAVGEAQHALGKEMERSILSYVPEQVALGMPVQNINALVTLKLLERLRKFL